MSELGADARSAVPDLIELASTGDALLKQNVLRALGKTGGTARDTVIPVLSEALRDSQKEVRVAAAEALTNLSTGQSNDLPIFTALLKNQQDAEIRVQARRGLAKLGKEAKPALADLVAAGKDGDKMVRKAVIDALIVFGPEAKNVVPIYSEALKDSDKELRKTALQALAKMGTESKSAVPAIRDLLKEAEYRKDALATLGKLGPVAKDAVPAIGDLLKDKDIDKDQKLEIMTTLAGMGPDAAKAVPNLILLFEDREISFRRRVAETIAKIGKPAVTPLVGALQDNSLLVRWGACDALGEIGPAARSPQVLAPSSTSAATIGTKKCKTRRRRPGRRCRGSERGIPRNCPGHDRHREAPLQAVEEPMKKKLPRLDSIQELAKFWDTHSLTDSEDELEEETEPVFVRNKPIPVHLEAKEAIAVRKIAKSKGVSQEELIRLWVKQRLARQKA